MDIWKSPTSTRPAAEWRRLFSAEKLPLFQNRVYERRSDALLAPTGALSIVFSDVFQFGFNAEFDSQLMVYSQDYDNAVPSERFYRYYDDIADYFIEKYRLTKDSFIVDIGCGNGVFLTRMADRYEFIQGLGIDPAYKGEAQTHGGRLHFIADEFRKDHLTARPDLVLLRHTLEHVPQPIGFLKEILAPLRNYKDVNLFVEVPDLDWILDQMAWWDFCYEHCNYFSDFSLAECISEAGATVRSVTPAFGGQYQWAEAVLNPTTEPEPYDSSSRISLRVNSLDKFLSSVNESFAQTESRVRALPENEKLIVWGMATKGIIFTLRLIGQGLKIDHCIDININKRGRYAPVSGFKIEAPESLNAGDKYSIICMNPNYADEIAGICDRLELYYSMHSPEIEKLIAT